LNYILSLTRLARTALALLLLAMPARVAPAQESVKPLPPEDRAYGLSLGEWIAAWWQWIGSIPTSTNPQTDTTGTRAGVGQRMPVWFLPNSFDPKDVTRTVFIPAGAAIFWAGPSSTALHHPGDRNEQQMRDELATYVREFLDQFTVMDVSVNGVPIPDVKSYRAQTPLFNLVLPPNNIWDITVAAGKDPRLVGVAEGFGFILPPLPVGKHVLVARMEIVENGTPLKLTLTHNLIIYRPNDPLP
jgi:hypothetical protein